MSDPMQAGPLIELVRSQQMSKESWADVTKTSAEQQQAITGVGLRATKALFSKNQLSPRDALNAFRAGIDQPGEMEFTQRMLARRTGTGYDYLRNTHDFLKSLIPSFANPALPGKEFLAYISTKEADVLEGLRQMPVNQAQNIAAHVSKPARGASFETGPTGWDKDASFYAYLEKDKAFIDSLHTLSEKERNEQLAARFAAWKEQAQASAFSGPSPTELGGKAGRRLDKQREAELLQRRYKMAATPEEQMAIFQEVFRSGAGVEIPAGKSEYSQMAWQAASENLTREAGTSLRLQSFNGGKTTTVHAIQNQDSWKVFGRSAIVGAFEEAALRNTDPTTAYRVHDASEGQVYSQWAAVANRPTEEQLSRMSVSSQIAAREKINKSILDTVGARKLNLGEQWQVEMPATAGIYNQNANALDTLRKSMGDLTDAMKSSRDAITKNTTVQDKLAQVFAPGGQSYEAARQTLAAAYQQTQGGQPLSPEMAQRLVTAQGVFSYSGRQGPFNLAGDILAGQQASLLEQDALATMASGGGRRGGTFSRIANKLFGGQPGIERGAAGALFDDVAFGWTAFRMRMIMGLTTSAQRGWRDQFYNEQGNVANAALMLGATPGTS
ncbi:hypothetical protein KC976_04340, partial [Candidatus Saccharibacteria bacterium]|nr:hypothetical protein [Candidatus Saccharibacteria bacterium]